MFFLESAEHVDDVRRICSPADVIIAPDAGLDHEDRNLVGYSGVFLEPGDEMTLNGRHTFELQEYLAAPFISIVGLTLVRLGSAAGLSAFLEDAETARRDGAFVDQLLSGAVALDSREAFVSGALDERLVRVHVSRDGEYRDGPDGCTLGRVGDDRNELERGASAWEGSGRAFARIVASDAFEREVLARPWLGRYVRALDLLRQSKPSLGELTVSGFGGHLLSALDDASSGFSVVDAHAPFLLREAGNGCVLVDWSSRRRFRLGIDAAKIAEALVAAGGDDQAVALLAASGVTGRTVAESVREVRRRFLAAGLDLTAFARAAA